MVNEDERQAWLLKKQNEHETMKRRRSNEESSVLLEKYLPRRK